MEAQAGFYKIDGEVLHYAPTGVISPSYVLSLENKDSVEFPLDGWIYAESRREATDLFGVPPEFGLAEGETLPEENPSLWEKTLNFFGFGG